MWSKNKKSNLNKLPPFVALTWELLNSEAYKKLPSSPSKALPYFLGKVKTGYNDPAKYLTKFTFTYTEAKRYGFASTTYYRLISNLMCFGFIDPVSKGGLRGDGYSSSCFRLSKRWMGYGTKNFIKTEKWSEFYQGKKL